MHIYVATITAYALYTALTNIIVCTTIMANVILISIIAILHNKAMNADVKKLHQLYQFQQLQEIQSLK